MDHVRKVEGTRQGKRQNPYKKITTTDERIGKKGWRCKMVVGGEEKGRQEHPHFCGQAKIKSEGAKWTLMVHGRKESRVSWGEILARVSREGANSESGGRRKERVQISTDQPKVGVQPQEEE